VSGAGGQCRGPVVVRGWGGGAAQARAHGAPAAAGLRVREAGDGYLVPVAPSLDAWIEWRSGLRTGG
jgi:hypothetical protein